MSNTKQPLPPLRRSAGRPPRERAQSAGIHEWVGGSLSAPFYITERDEPYRPRMVLWLELPEGFVLATEMTGPEEVAGSVGRVLAKAMRSPLIGSPRRPPRIRVADPSLVQEIRAEVGMDIAIELAPTPELDEILAEMSKAMPDGDEKESYLEDGRVPPALVEYLFRCAELLHRLAPWKLATDDRVLRLDIPELDVEGACVAIIGALGESFGLLIFPSLVAYDAFAGVADEPLPPRRVDLGTELLSLEFERGAALPASMRREIAKHGWPVAGASAYPRVSARERDGVCRPLTARDVRIAAVCASAMTAFFARHREAFEADESPPLCESHTDEHVYGATATLTLPYEAFDLFQPLHAARAQPPLPERSGPTPSRNAPCPCGSGKKYKKCHLRLDEAEAAPRKQAQALHELDARLVRAIGEFGVKRYGDQFLRSCDNLVAGEDGFQLSVPFALYMVRIDGETVLERYLAERAKRLSGEERAWLAAQRAAWLSVWEVIEVVPGERLSLRDLLSNEVRQVREVSASHTLVARDAVLGRVVDHAGLSLLCGMHPRRLSPFDAAEVVERARKRLRLRRAAHPDRLRDETFGRYLVARWEEGVSKAERHASILPELKNTDGDPFILTTDHFEVDSAVQSAVEERLTGLEGVERESTEGNTSSFVFLRPGNRTHKSWDTTVIGHASLSDAGLRLETNSLARADSLRRRVEGACGHLIRHRAREHSDPLSHKAPQPSAHLPATPPEAAQLLLDFKQRHYLDWLDQPVPALGGKTPREAARSASDRASLDVLLKDLENHEARGERATAYDVSELRRELGLA